MTWAAATATAVAIGSLGWVIAKRRPFVRGDSRPKPRRHVPGLDVSTTQFWLVSIGAAAFTLVSVLAITGLLVVSLVPALVVATLPRAYFARKHAQRLASVQEAWPDGLRDLVSSIRSGSSLPAAVESLAAFGPEPLRHAFQGFDVYSRSLGVEAALEMVKEDLADPTSDRVVEVMILAQRRGGSVVPQILSDLADATTRDLWANEQVRTDALEQKINSRVVFILPWLVLVAMTAQSSAFRAFYSSPAGVAVVVAGGILSLVGIAIASRLGTQPVEPRVFGGGE